MNNQFLKYFKEYKWSNILSMVRNSKIDSKICNEEF